MHPENVRSKRVWLAVILGAIAGGLLIVLAGRVIPRLASRIVAEAMQKMMTKMGEDGCDPAMM